MPPRQMVTRHLNRFSTRLQRFLARTGITKRSGIALKSLLNRRLFLSAGFDLFVVQNIEQNRRKPDLAALWSRTKAIRVSRKCAGHNKIQSAFDSSDLKIHFVIHTITVLQNDFNGEKAVVVRMGDMSSHQAFDDLRERFGKLPTGCIKSAMIPLRTRIEKLQKRIILCFFAFREAVMTEPNHNHIFARRIVLGG
jgi:hypothetical protein